MDNQRSSSEEDRWVDERLAALVPAGDWHPDSNRALLQFKKRQYQKEMGMETLTLRSVPWIRFSMVAAVLASIGLVVALLPWSSFWKQAAENKSPSESVTPTAVQESARTPVPPTPPVGSAPAAVISQNAQSSRDLELKPLERSGQDSVRPFSPNSESYYSDDLRRAHIQRTTALQTQPQRVGPGVTPPKAIPPLAEPIYSDDASKAHIQGSVVLSVIIGTDGTGKVEKVVRSLGYGLDERAIEAFEKWRFEPAMKDAKPIDVQWEVTINFRLY